jgi:hypothetical protein
VRHRGGGGRGVGGRGAGCRRTRRSPVRRHRAEEAAALVGEATGGGGRDARRWRGDVRCSRKQCSPAGEAWGGGGRGAMSDSARLRARGVGMHGVRSRGVDRAARGQMGVGMATDRV